MFIVNKLKQISQDSGFPYKENIKRKTTVFLQLKNNMDDLYPEHFEIPLFYQVILTLINFDNQFKTNILRRIVYPQVEEDQLVVSPSNLFLVKMSFNGSKRAIVTQINEEKNMTRKQEIYP